ncbi:dipeptidase [Arsenicitalea aurantiaca]|uniref:Dipeptidase n=1 Tax=Arsenicitalea aurantiaca TaxID=1783274 RepID=A0A433X5E1_9HYPH|nr:dipeptidase [Arsenicitalea aurantiaca]RUT29295.1 dipeptidase [Arsenicitalea aurantiaca]
MTDPRAAAEAVLAHVDANLEQSLSRLEALLRIPSISTEPAFAAQCRAAAEWLRADLQGEGFEASLRDTEGHPMVVAHDKAAEGPHVLFYGHYDVQPVDPLDLWHTDPFEPVRLVQPDGETHISARGASDDKGQLMTFVEACRAWRAVTGSLPVKVTMLFEGEEEAGSPSLLPFLERTGPELTADIALVSDTDMWDKQTPSIVTMLRGLVGEEIEITCADKDLHSGMFGGAARNPLQLLSEIIASMRNPDGSVALEGFYDDVAELPPEVAEQWKRLPFSDTDFLAGVGLSVPAGETGRTVLEQITSRPTFEVNGMIGGYTGDGFKTVIASKARAKISFRLVSGQDPDKIREAFRAHVRARLPADASVTFHAHGGSPAIAVPADGPFLNKALGALGAEWGREAAIAGSGGSIPIVGAFKRQLGMDTLLIGFAQIDDRIHSPNEKYNLTSFRKGIRSWVRVLAAFAQR